MSAPDLCRKQGISDATFYKWRRKYGGMEVADAKCVKSLISKLYDLRFLESSFFEMQVQ